MTRATTIRGTEFAIASSPLPPAEMSSVSTMTGRRPNRSDSQPWTGERNVWLVHIADCKTPYATADAPTSRTRKGNTGTSTVFAICASVMIENGPTSRAQVVHDAGERDLVKPSGRCRVTGTHISPSSSLRPGIGATATAERRSWVCVRRTARRRTEDRCGCPIWMPCLLKCHAGRVTMLRGIAIWQLTEVCHCWNSNLCPHAHARAMMAEDTGDTTWVNRQPSQPKTSATSERLSCWAH